MYFSLVLDNELLLLITQINSSPTCFLGYSFFTLIDGGWDQELSSLATSSHWGVEGLLGW